MKDHQSLKNTAKYITIDYILHSGLIASDMGNAASKINKVNIIGIAVNISEKSMIIDDGTGTINVMTSEIRTKKQGIAIGDPICVIGFCSHYESEMIIIGDIITKLNSTKWLDLRKIELMNTEIKADNNDNNNSISEKTTQQEKQPEPKITETKYKESEPKSNENQEISESSNEYKVESVIFEEKKTDGNKEQNKPEEDKRPKPKIVREIIKELDSGDGADIDEIVLKSEIDETEKIIDNLLRDGEIYEIRPGRVKLL